MTVVKRRSDKTEVILLVGADHFTSACSHFVGNDQITPMIIKCNLKHQYYIRWLGCKQMSLSIH